MFNKNLGTCQLTNDEANLFFTNIVGQSQWHFKRDYTLLAVARALLYRRLKPEDDIFAVRIKNSNLMLNILTSNENRKDLIFDAMADLRSVVNSITLCNVSSSEDATQVTFSYLDDPKSGFVVIAKGFREAMDLRQFVSQHKVNARFYINEAKKSAVIIADHLELRSYHFLISLMPRFIPWYLKEIPLDEEEIQLCKSLTDRYSLKTERMLDVFCKRIDFRSHRIKRLMTDFERRSRDRQLKEAELRVRNANDRIRENMDNYVALIRRLEDEKIRLEGIRQAIQAASDSSELVQYLIRSKYINPIEVGDRYMTAIIHSYLDVFDPAMAERMLRKDSSILLSGYGVSDNNNVFRNIEKRKKLLGAIFSEEPTLKIKTCAHFKLELAGEVYPSRSYRYPKEYEDMLPNPHLNRYECLGQNRRMMRERLLAGDIVGCLMQCVASVKCLNMADTPVVQYFMSVLFHSTQKVIELPDKTSVTIVDALSYLEQQEAAAQPTATEEPAQQAAEDSAPQAVQPENQDPLF